MHKLYRSTGLCDVIENGVLVGESPTLRCEFGRTLHYNTIYYTLNIFPFYTC